MATQVGCQALRAGVFPASLWVPMSTDRQPVQFGENPTVFSTVTALTF